MAQEILLKEKKEKLINNEVKRLGEIIEQNNVEAN